MRKTRFVLCCLGLLVGFSASISAIDVQPIPGLPDTFIRGADISMLEQVEKSGGKYYDANGKQSDLLVILKNDGVNWIRLRIWNNPVEADGNNNLACTIRLAQRAKKMGFKVLLDFHYSDFWTDPGHQTKPAAWNDLDMKGLGNAVYQYTFDTLKALSDAGAMPDMVQTGNEMNGGLLWPDGKTWQDGSEKIGGYEGFALFLKQAGKAVRDADPNRGTANKIKIVIHLANGGDMGLYQSTFNELVARGVDFDVIGLSWYPYWHGSLKGLSENLNDLAVRYGKELAVVETAYAWTLEDGDACGNLFQMSVDENGGYLPTVQGQATVLRDLMATVAAVPQRKGLGVFYWEPDWIPVTGAGWKSGEGNNWENQAMFDYTGKELASLSVFKRVYDTAAVPAATITATRPLSIGVVAGDKPVLPGIVLGEYTDGSIRPVSVTWDIPDAAVFSQVGEHQLTGKIVGSSIPAKATLKVAGVKNLFEDPSFESGTLNGWVLDGSPSACFAEKNESNAHSGGWTYKYWLAKPFSSVLSRTFTDLPNGRYTVKLWAAGGGADKKLSLTASGFDGDKVLESVITNTGWKKWKQYVIEGVEVKNGTCTIGIHIDSSSGTWGNFDDVEFYKEP